jgi:hypothetical protein
MKQQSPQYNQWTVPNVTTAGPGFVQAITLDSTLVEKTRWVLLYRDQGGLTASVVRDSSSTSGQYIEDRYVWVESEWKFRKKIRGKWQTLPEPPSDACKTDIHNVPFFTLHEPTPDEIDMMKRLMPLPKAPDIHLVSIVAHSTIR